MNHLALRSGERMTLVLMACAFLCMVLSIVVGSLGALYYLPELSEWMLSLKLSLVQIRPLHTTFASAWIFLARLPASRSSCSSPEGPRRPKRPASNFRWSAGAWRVPERS